MVTCQFLLLEGVPKIVEGNWIPVEKYEHCHNQNATNNQKAETGRMFEVPVFGEKRTKGNERFQVE